MNEYKLTITVVINEQDDPGAGRQAYESAEALNIVVSGADEHLKQVYMAQPPRGVKMS